MNYEEWDNLIRLSDEDNPFTPLYKYETGEMFYVEPAFYTQLMNLGEIYPSYLPLIIDEMARIVKKEGRVIFVHDYDNPLTHKEDFIYLELTDVCDPLHIYVEDKSRGSDYGD